MCVVSFLSIRNQAVAHHYCCDSDNKEISNSGIDFIKKSTRIYKVVYKKKNRYRGDADKNSYRFSVQSIVHSITIFLLHPKSQGGMSGAA